MSDKVNDILKIKEKELKNLKTVDKSTKKKGKWGGVRANSGRKPKVAAEARELLYATIDKSWPMIIENIEYYLKKKDKDILKYIIDQRMGRAGQFVELAGSLKTESMLNDDQFGKLIQLMDKK